MTAVDTVGAGGENPPAPHRAARDDDGRRRSLPRAALRRLGNIAAATVGGVATGLLLVAVALSATGHRVTTVLSGSMVPALPIGTMVVTEHVTAADIHAGDVVVFPNPGHADVTMIHRIVSITPTGGDALQAHTRGDANPVEDPWVLVVDRRTPVDRAVRAFVGVGTVVDLLRRSALELLVVVLVGSCAIAGVRRVWAS